MMTPAIERSNRSCETLRGSSPDHRWFRFVSRCCLFVCSLVCFVLFLLFWERTEHSGPVAGVPEGDGLVVGRAVPAPELGGRDDDPGGIGFAGDLLVPDGDRPAGHPPGEGAEPGGPAHRGRRVGLHHLEAVRPEGLEVRQAGTREGIDPAPVVRFGRGRGPRVHEDQVVRLHDDDVRSAFDQHLRGGGDGGEEETPRGEEEPEKSNQPEALCRPEPRPRVDTTHGSEEFLCFG